MMKRWREIKSKHADCVVFFRLGDFYEMFFEDAELASRTLGITLTARDCGMEKRAPMCGIPYHAAATYIKKLVDAGFHIAICEQLTQPTAGKLVDREVVKIITPGTYNDEGFLDAQKNNFIASVYTSGEVAAVAWCDITTGEFYAMNTSADHLPNVTGMIGARETISSNGNFAYAFNAQNAHDAILEYFGITNLSIFDLEKGDKIINAAGALLQYLLHTGKQTLKNITGIRIIRKSDFMMLDKSARENLELDHPIRNAKTRVASLLWVLDETKSPMGARQMALWVASPLQNISQITERLDAVEMFVNNAPLLRDLRTQLAGISDISRLCGRIAGGDITPREFLNLASALERLDGLKNVLAGTTGLVKTCNDKIAPMPEIVDLIRRVLNENCGGKIDEGGFVRAGFDPKLDEYRDAEKYGREWLAKLEATEREECHVRELKIAYNRVTGYYFEVPTRCAANIPYRFTRKGTTANTERFTTPELKNIEVKIIHSQERAIEMEQKIYANLRQTALDKVKSIIENGQNVAVIDALQSFAQVAVQNDYVRPKLNTEGRIELKNARHPVIESLVGRDKFIANDTQMAGDTMLITGPNMAGKSTYMRMVALVTIMAHMGSFVPAKSANVAITDRIFTRIGASDSLATGESTFMVEMNEVSNIVHNATRQSLVLLDEVGRGTGTGDGLALAGAIIEYITDKIGANTMFATHFHELTNLAKSNPKIQNYKVTTTQNNGDIVFLHKLEPGIEANSFGIDVAKLAGLPREIIDRARGLLK
jgi:DNA mismatch repair protein MutS